MVSAPRPAHRSQRRSRRRQLALVCGVFSYLAVFAAGVLALLSLATPIGDAAVVALIVAAGFVLGALGLWALDTHATQQVSPPAGPRPA
jgi:hypothetical protein